MPQLVTRIDNNLLQAIDSLVANGSVGSRSEAVRDALALWIGHLTRQADDARIVAVYLRQPQTTSEIAWAVESGRRMIEDEPW
jgi:Arc/MetJ-type ribon-helix-helix transcriptional regulator